MPEYDSWRIKAHPGREGKKKEQGILSTKDNDTSHSLYSFRKPLSLNFISYSRRKRRIE